MVIVQSIYILYFAKMCCMQWAKYFVIHNGQKYIVYIVMHLYACVYIFILCEMVYNKHSTVGLFIKLWVSISFVVVLCGFERFS